MKKELLKTRIIRETLTLIASGGFTANQKLPTERQLCKKFGVSRGTIRQALTALEKMGVVKVKPGSGTYVRKPVLKKVPARILPPNFEKVALQDIIEARRAIEAVAIVLACKKITKKQIFELEKLVDKMEMNLDDLPEFLKYDMKFHDLIVSAAGNTPLETAFDAIYEYHKYSQIFSSSNNNCESLALFSHRCILQAIKNRNQKMSKKLLNKHFDEIIGLNRK